jgi:hypothetical protein
MWQPINQQASLTDLIGEELSKRLPCHKIRYVEPHYHKPLFECGCDKSFPLFVVQPAYESGDWNPILELHGAS